MTEPTARPRPTLAITVCAVIIAVIGLLVAYSRSRDERPVAKVGQVIEAADPLAGVRKAVVLLPTERLDVLSTAPLDDVDRDAEVRRTQAPDDGSFVGLQVTSTLPTGADTDVLPAERTVESTKVVIGLTLIADGRRYPLEQSEFGATDNPVPLRHYVAVAGRPDSLRLEVKYQTKTQSVDLRTGARSPGEFADLYRNRPRTQSCGAATTTAGVTPVYAAGTCSVRRVLRTPHLPGLEWAPAGRSWLVVRVETAAADGYRYRAPGGAVVRYETGRTREVTYRLGGAVPALPVTGPVYSTAPSTKDVVFSVPRSGDAGGLTVTSTERPRLRYDSEGSGAPTLSSISTTWRVQL